MVALFSSEEAFIDERSGLPRDLLHSSRIDDGGVGRVSVKNDRGEQEKRIKIPEMRHSCEETRH